MDEISSDPASPQFAARRAKAREELDAIDPAKNPELLNAAPADPLRRDWFEAVYRLAQNDPARVPWANLAPHPLTKAWVGAQAKGVSGLRALDVGCGLGDNAECLAAAGAKVTAFDLVPAAVEWARTRFPRTEVEYQGADLFALPNAWRGAFDLVHECYTLQALSAPLLPQALAALASLLTPNGKLLLIARARDEDAASEGPPWPLPPSIFAEARRQGLTPLSIEDIAATADVGRRHWRALFGRAEGRAL
ncbi:class I SAM-dependent methyltransferase [Methylocapsa acidiphila]|uniref:class I SAM-dependent methyltransferase n=1 Tax=Methylocapsa acidiphila TaxID=133552 RepID=UPI001FD9B7FD|nr:class I SAM-dependent methyltransferase [Methylocapsa acidiphila]